MRKLLCFILALTMLTAFAACGEASPDTPAETAAPQASAAVPADGPRTVEAATVDELLAAIAPDTVIELTGACYTLTEASNYGMDSGSDYYYWDGCDPSDGFGLVIRDVDGLTIRAASLDTGIVTEPRWVNVLSFVDCDDIRLEGFTAGHIDGAHCSGGVVSLENVNNAVIDGCSLYGCGTEGVTAFKCDTLSVTGTEIWNCSLGAASVNGSKNVSFDNCDIHGINAEWGLFKISGSEKIAVLNSSIYDNDGDLFVNSSYSGGVYLGGCEINNNKFRDVFASTVYPVTVEGCAFTDNDIIRWYADMSSFGYNGENMKAADPDGKVYSYSELWNMEKTEKAVWNGMDSKPAERELTEADDGKVHASTVDELLAAIAPDVTVYLEPGIYDLSTAAGYGSYSTDSYYWEERYDGPSLTITGVSGLTIEGAGADEVTIAAAPRYADVLAFEKCEGLTLRGFTAGHTEEPGSCTGGVLDFELCEGVSIEDCSLFGCGIMGITARDCSELIVRATEIYDCEYGGLTFFNSSAELENCNIHDNGGPDYQLYESTITVDGEKHSS